jgi:catechol 2,3-dioxygenase-like lactoylglutathione lyase family enzyme
MSISKITPILIVNSVDRTLPFWRDELGYEVVHTVPHEGQTGFAILKREDSELMLQSAASVKDDLKIPGAGQVGRVLLYADVDSLDKTMATISKDKVLIPKRKTSYGATESWIETPSGTILGLAELTK